MLLIVVVMYPNFKPKSVLLSTLIIFSIETLLALLWGRINELRIYYETFPLALTATVSVVAKMLDSNVKHSIN